MLSAWKNCSTSSCGVHSESVTSPIVGKEVEKVVKVCIVIFDTVIFALVKQTRIPAYRGASESVKV